MLGTGKFSLSNKAKKSNEGLTFYVPIIMIYKEEVCAHLICNIRVATGNTKGNKTHMEASEAIPDKFRKTLIIGSSWAFGFVLVHHFLFEEKSP